MGGIEFDIVRSTTLCRCFDYIEVVGRCCCCFHSYSYSEGSMEGTMQLAYETVVKLMLAALERNVLPDVITRRLTRLLLATRLRSAYKPSSQLQLSDLLYFAHCTLSLSLSVTFSFSLLNPTSILVITLKIRTNPYPSNKKPNPNP